MHFIKIKMILLAVIFLLPSLLCAEEVYQRKAISFDEKPVMSPGSSLGTPVGYGAAWKQAFVGIGGTDGVGNTNRVDGAAVIGAGLGDPQEYVGLEIATTIISLKTRFADSGAVNFKLHRWLPWNSAVAIGVENAVTWGTAKKANVKANTYLTFTKATALAPENDYNPFWLTASIGVGNGRFEPINTNPTTTKTKVGVFGSLGLQIHPKVSVISSWTGKDLNMGLSLVPFTKIPVVLSIGRVDLLKKNQPASRWVASFGYAIF